MKTPIINIFLLGGRRLERVLERAFSIFYLFPPSLLFLVLLRVCYSVMKTRMIKMLEGTPSITDVIVFMGFLVLFFWLGYKYGKEVWKNAHVDDRTQFIM
jgi:hypothetical protein